MSIPAATGLSRIDRASIKDLALQQLKRYILSGSMKPGDRLPAERSLAEQLGVGRSSVREALKVLEAIGLVESRIGEGTFITNQGGASIGRTIGASLAVWGSTIVEILEARRIIEVEAARVAAERAEPDDLVALERELHQMEVAGDDFAAYFAADMQFHRLVSHATHNAIVGHIVDNLIGLLTEALREGHGDQLRTSAENAATHAELFGALVRRDGVGAADAMRRHLQFTTELWQTVVSLGSAGNSAPPAPNEDTLLP